MGRTKLQRFQIIAERRNVIEPGKEIFQRVKGNWRTDFFRNDHELIAEVGCGKGEYTIGMANLFSNKNFVGIDIKGSRIWKGSTLADQNGLTNAAFLRNAVENLNDNFAPGEIDELWITFPDPRPRLSDAKRRLTSERFLNLYEDLVKKAGIIHFKTDSEDLFTYTLELLQKRKATNLIYTFDLYASDLQHHTLNIQTTYEKRFLAEGVKIKYLQYLNS
ncbi:MAG: tRNA (guanosine(46)-N7)-methyltransferase TrmB [Cytophagales bacterium CG18_big_fil_WC_8_21_14_2_50_42_9]|nr:MAG: tRNA (guanosine(46)-N7)-methyltransferase TrmB [Cytophagales bacterium CG18_big_fil_WC_8_21_14_2_50_42_9]